jgi:hypothetical protein
MPFSLSEFKDFSAGLQSIALVVATFLGGGWALFQFFSLRALEKAKLELEKAKRELLQQGILIIDLGTESFDIDGSYFLHVLVVVRSIGSGFEIVDWAKASMFATRFHKVDEITLAPTGPVLLGWRQPYIAEPMRLMPGYSTSQSYLIPIPQVGVYYIEFSMPVSPAAMKDTLDAIKTTGAQTYAEFEFSEVSWPANKFVSVPQTQPNTALRAVIETAPASAIEMPSPGGR